MPPSKYICNGQKILFDKSNCLIHKLHGGDVYKQWGQEIFQSTPPHGGDGRHRLRGRVHLGFNPRPRRGGRRAALGLVGRVVEVSIHTPAWGATESDPECPEQHDVSIHAPAWGATVHLCFGCYVIQSFNPRPRMGGDSGSQPMLHTPMFQSTPPHGGRRRQR